MCEHLIELEKAIKEKGIKETFRGQAWTDNCREWVYFDCLLALEKLKLRFNFADCVIVQINNDSRSGMEAGFYCSLCKDAVMGVHPQFREGKIIFG